MYVYVCVFVCVCVCVCLGECAFYRPQGKVMYTEASVILFTRGGGVPPGQRNPLDREPLTMDLGPDRKRHHTPPPQKEHGTKCK